MLVCATSWTVGRQYCFLGWRDWSGHDWWNAVLLRLRCELWLVIVVIVMVVLMCLMDLRLVLDLMMWDLFDLLVWYLLMMYLSMLLDLLYLLILLILLVLLTRMHKLDFSITLPTIFLIPTTPTTKLFLSTR